MINIQDNGIVVIKIGTNGLARPDGLGLNFKFIKAFVTLIVELISKGLRPIIVTSGAVLAGMEKMEVTKRPTGIVELQEFAAVGQVPLMGIYEKFFNQHGIKISQHLLDADIFELQDQKARSKKNNFVQVITGLLAKGVVPFINENDAVVAEEIKNGDNDKLSALVAVAIQANLLLIFTDVDGLYRDKPDSSTIIHEVQEITAEIIGIADGKSESGLGTGGMWSKVNAARLCEEYIPVALLNAHKLFPEKGGYWSMFWRGDNPGTIFYPLQF